MKENRSPWLHNFKYERPLRQLTGTVYTDISIVGGGIAGAVTAFMLLKNTDKKIVLIEGDLIAHGATGHNAGYVVSEFEKPFKDIVKEYGLDVARSGQKELESAWDLYFEIREEIGLSRSEKIEGHEVFSDLEHFLEFLHEEYLKYGAIESKVYLLGDSSWYEKIPDNFKESIALIAETDLQKMLGTQSQELGIYKAVVTNELAIANSALFTEELVKYCLQKFETRFEVFEKTFVNSVRLLQNSNSILDSLYGVCVSDKVVLCTNGFENFNIYGPYGMKVDQEFHHSVSGLIGYMVGIFRKGDKQVVEGGNIFYGDEYKFNNGPYDSGPYVYGTNRKFELDNEKGELFSVGGPEIKLHDRRIYKKDHLVDSTIYEKLEKFQRDMYNVQEKAIFKWHGLMGYTSTGIRMVGQDKRFNDLFYNLGCNGIGIIPSVAGAKRIAKLINGEKLPRSVFDPR